MATVGVTEICRILAGEGKPPLTPMRITQLVREGMPKAERGQYDPVRCMYWYLGKLRSHVEHKEGEDGRSTQGERKRLLKAQADREELELAKARQEIISITDHTKILGDLAVETRALVQAIPARAAADLVGESSRVMIQAKLEKHCNFALTKLASLVPRAPQKEAVKEEPAPKVKAKPAGRKTKKG